MASGDYINTLGFGSGEAQDIMLLGFYYEVVNVYVESADRRLKHIAESRFLAEPAEVRFRKVEN